VIQRSLVSNYCVYKILGDLARYAIKYGKVIPGAGMYRSGLRDIDVPPELVLVESGS
jgi:hypothetical protein